MNRRKIAILIIASVLLSNLAIFYKPNQTKAAEIVSMTEVSKHIDRYLNLDQELTITVSNKQELLEMTEYLNQVPIGKKLQFELMTDIALSEYTYVYSEEKGRIGIFYAGKIDATYDVTTGEYYSDWDSDEVCEYEWKCDSFEPIGRKSESRYDQVGSFDGNGHTIRGIYQKSTMNAGKAMKTGLFSAFHRVENLNVDQGFFMAKKVNATILGQEIEEIYNCKISNVNLVGSGCDYVGAIDQPMGPISFVDVDANFFVENSRNGYVGMIAGIGYSANASITNCETKGRIQSLGASGIVGGVVGRMSDDLQSSRVIDNCNNRAKIMGEWRIAGGIVGELTGNVLLGNCNNYATLDLYTNTGIDGDVLTQNNGFSEFYAGGICGLLVNKNATVNQCYNYGEMKTDYMSQGGIVGKTWIGEVVNSANLANITYDFSQEIIEQNPEYSVFYERNKYTGGLTGNLEAGKGTHDGGIYNCYNAGNVTAVWGNVGALSGNSDLGQNAIPNSYSLTEEQNLEELLQTLNQWVRKTETSENGYSYNLWEMVDNKPVLIPQYEVVERPVVHPFVVPTATPVPSEISVPTEQPVPTKIPTATEQPTPAKTPTTPKAQVTTEQSTPTKVTKGKTKLAKPTFSIKKKKADSQKYLQISIKKYKGKYVEIWVKKGKKKFKKLKLKENRIKKLKKKINIRYSAKKIQLAFRMRTYQKKKGKVQYSEYSKIKRIQIA